jgi:hypothetical protein
LTPEEQEGVKNFLKDNNIPYYTYGETNSDPESRKGPSTGLDGDEIFDVAVVNMPIKLINRGSISIETSILYPHWPSVRRSTIVDMDTLKQLIMFSTIGIFQMEELIQIMIQFGLHLQQEMVLLLT